MATFTYNPNVPNPPDNPSADVGDMQTNAGSISSLIAVDHVGFNLSNGGFHNLIHIPAQTVGGQSSWNPIIGSGPYTAIQATAIAGVEQVFAMNSTPNSTLTSTTTQLFAMAGNNNLFQLTGILAGTDGYFWSGGILIQWGKVALSSGIGTSTHRTGTVTFKDRVSGAIPFPNACYSIQTTLTSNTTAQTAPASTTLGIFSLSATSFTWVFNTSSNITDTPNFYWMALGI